MLFTFFIFFFQAEDGIRDLTVTGVQTCALPIFYAYRKPRSECEVSRGDVKLPVQELGMLAGWVDLYGHIVEHADGYRAESALVAGLVLGGRALFPLRRACEGRAQAGGPNREGPPGGGN